MKISKNKLYDLYWKQDLSPRKIAEIIGYSPNTVRRALIRFGIKIRNLSESLKGKSRIKPVKYKMSKEKLNNLYWEQDLSTSEIGKIFGCSMSTVCRRMREFGISMKNPKVRKTIFPIGKEHWNYGHDKYPQVNQEFLEREYVQKQKSKWQIRKEIGCGSSIIVNKLKKYNIPIRTISEALIGKKRPYLSGPNNPNFTDGRTARKNFCIDCLKKGIKTEISWNAKKCPTHAKKGKKCPKINKTLKKLWQNKKFREKQIKAFMKAGQAIPNKSEKQLNKLLQRLLPNEYKINVKGTVMTLGTKIPDFVNVNGQKKVIEMNGDYWHSKKRTGRTKKQEEQQRINYFKKLGYKTLIVWEHELKNLGKVEQRILIFNQK